MESQGYNGFAKPYTNLVRQDEAMNRYLPPPWSTPIQAYHNFGYIPTPNLRPVDSYIHPSWAVNQIWNRPLQYDSLHDYTRLSNYPMTAGFGQGAPLALSENGQGIFAERNYLDSMNKRDENLQPITTVIAESGANGKSPSIPKTNWEGITWSAASESMESPVIRHVINNAPGSSNFLSKLQNFPSVSPDHKQQPELLLLFGNDTASQEANPTVLNQDLGTEGVILFGTNLQPEKLEGDETKESRKRKTKTELAKLSKMQKKDGDTTKEPKMSKKELSKLRKMRKKQEYKDRRKNVNKLRAENERLRKKLLRFSKKCEKLTDENESLMEELVEKCGEEEVVAYLKDLEAELVAGTSGSDGN